MKRFAFVVAAALAAGSPAWAQGGPGAGPGPRAGRGPGMRMFDPATVTTVSGTIESVDRVRGQRGNEGVHLVLKTGDGLVDVPLGPSFYVDKQEPKLSRGDAVEVTGSKVQLAGKPALVAQTVKKGDATMTLRDASGVPLWAGPRR